ncbi:MAG: hypothetical protein IJ605_00295 [Prevotella sp.]|nr:hypothetical protein [Prevotella sp.]
MKKITSLLAMLVAIVTTAFAQDYAVSIDKTLKSTHPSRYNEKVGFDGGSVINFSSKVNDYIYHDLTNRQPLVVKAGTELTPLIGYRGWAMYGYLYIDYNNDGDFSDEGETVSQMTGNDWVGGSTEDKTIPQFTITSTPGTYHARYKVEWDNPDPHNINSGIAENGGSIVDVIIVVQDNIDTSTAESNLSSCIWPLQELYGVTDASKISSNHQQSNEGTIAGLIDNIYSGSNNFFHSNWSAGAETNGVHDLIYELPEATTSIRFYIKQRDTGTGRPEYVTVSGSNDGSDYTKVTDLSMVWGGSPLDTYSDEVTAATEYKFWKFEVNITNSTKATNGAGNRWFCVSEWYVLPNNNSVKELFDAANALRAGDNVSQAIEEVNSAKQTVDADIAAHTKYSVTYKVVDTNNTELKSIATEVYAGTVISTFPDEMYKNLFYTYSDVTETTVTEDVILTITATPKESAPFVPSTSFDEATWYYATIRGSKFIRADESHKDASGRYQTSNTNEETDVYKWAFFGNPYSNFWIANKEHGAGKYLTAPNTTNPTMAEVADPANTENAKWEVIENGNGFTLRSLTGEHQYINDNASSGCIGYWVSSWGREDIGSRWNLTKVPENQITYITALDQLSNDKVYAIYNVRAMWNLAGTSLSADKNAISDLDEAFTNPGTHQIAIVNKEGKYYLYSVTEKKYLASNNKLYDSPIEAVNIASSNATSGNYQWFFNFEDYTDRNINTNSAPAIEINYWTTHDIGNIHAIMETSATYSQSDALTAFEDYTQCITDYCDLKGINSDFTEKIGKLGYPKDGTDATTAFTDIMDRNANGENTAEDWSTFKSKYEALTATENVKMPEAGMFLRIKTAPAWANSTFSGEQPYLIAENNNNNRAVFSKTAGEDAASIWCWLEHEGTNYLVSYKTGYAAINNSNNFLGVGENEQVMTTNGTSVAFKLAVNGEAGAFNISFNDGGRWLYTDPGLYTDAGSNSNGNGYNFTLEEVTELPITLTEVDGLYYATFSAPVDIVEITGATLHKISVVEDKYVKYEEANATGLPANTGVLLISDTSGEATATIGEYTGDAVETNLSAQIASVTGSDGLFFGKGADSGKLGFFALADGMATKGFKAFVANETAGGAKGLEFIDNEATGIDSINNSQFTIDNGAIYNLQGQKVNKAQKGVFIQNGRKVVVK